MAQNIPVDFVTFAGLDNRYQLLFDTFKVIHPYFNRIHLLDTGSTDETPKLARDFDNILYRRIEGLDNSNFAKTVTIAIDKLDIGQWFVFMDSDERPSQLILDTLQSDLSFMSKHGIGQGFYFGHLHNDGCSDIPKGKTVEKLNNITSVGRLVGEVKPQPVPGVIPNLFVKSPVNRYYKNQVNCSGAHFAITAYNQSVVFLPAYYNHMKTRSQAVSSWVMCSWPVLQYYGLPVTEPENSQVQQLAQKYQIPSGQELYRLAIKGQLPLEVLALIDSWQTHKYGICRAYWEWKNKFNFTPVPTQPICGEPCCLYANGVQY